uniref:Uncharacterized protein n=1 Tax=Molossus molossus TaxID=27622 RepID=A0A7J8GKU4_MOLMO|nr:hypothetical protein HJG59_011460 [Molossus molossus]
MGLTETQVKPESMRGRLRSLGYASLCSQLLQARQVSRGAGETAGVWVPLEAWFPGPGWEEVWKEKQRVVRERTGRIPVGPGRVEGPAPRSLLGSRFTSKIWGPGTVLGTEENVMPSFWSGAFYRPSVRPHFIVAPLFAGFSSRHLLNRCSNWYLKSALLHLVGATKVIGPLPARDLQCYGPVTYRRIC